MVNNSLKINTKYGTFSKVFLMKKLKANRKFEE